jgi:hypothetical protein
VAAGRGRPTDTAVEYIRSLKRKGYETLLRSHMEGAATSAPERVRAALLGYEEHPDIAADETPSHRYADGELRGSDYVATLCRKVGMEDFDALWDTLFEIDCGLTPAEYTDQRVGV